MATVAAILKHRFIPGAAATCLFLLGGAAAASADTTLSATQARRLSAAAVAFSQGDYRPAAHALPALENTYMGPWVGYWALQPRLKSITQSQYQRYADRFPSGVAHHLLRQQWLLQLAHRKDWPDFTEVYQAGSPPDLLTLRCDAARDPLLASTLSVVSPFVLWSGAAAGNHACNAMARTALKEGRISQAELWRRLQQMYEASAFSAALPFAPFLPAAQSGQLAQSVKTPAAWISQQIQRYGAAPWPVEQTHLLVLALLRLAAVHPAQAVQFTRNLRVLSSAEKSLILYNSAYHATLTFRPESGRWYADAYAADAQFHPRPRILAWMVRTALREHNWRMVEQAVEQMDPAQRAQRQWRFWSAIALLRRGYPQAARSLLTPLESPWTYYGQLAMATLQKPLVLRPTDPPASPRAEASLDEQVAVRRAIKLYQLGLYYDALAEWNQVLTDLRGTPAIRAAARVAFAHQSWLLGIHASSLIPGGEDWEQGYVLPYAQEIAAAAAQTGLRKAFLAGLIRQESGFARGIQSGVGAQGLMQVMPATANWLQTHIPAAANADLHSTSGNLILGSNYLHLQQQQFGGSELLAAAAYNAGPAAAKRWLERWTPAPGPWAGPIFTANIPYRQTRHYVQRVLTNTSVYAAILDRQPQSIWPQWRLGTVPVRATGSSTPSSAAP
ncbi:transglycosylase SLT domain-containing protein [Acidithiobacillus ferrianus]|uniref:transglycosylase SLT domain-containing protein n=1 Tax=Acidithiobacillus ferrianus TaxID=2678518 RepID=UPI0034E3CAA1